MKCALLAILLLVPAAAAATTHRVPSEYATIQAGIDACAEGDTVLVAPGVYSLEDEYVSFAGKDIALIGEAGAASTTLQRSGWEGGIQFMGSESRAALLEGFTLRGTTFVAEGAVAVAAGAAPTLRELIFHDTGYISSDSHDTWSSGDALFCMGAPLVVDCTFESNVGGDGCVFVDGSPEFVDAAFHLNAAYRGGAVYLTGGSASFVRCEFTSNAAKALNDVGHDIYGRGMGGAVCARGSAAPYFEDCVFLDNTAEGLEWTPAGPLSGSGGAVFAKDEAVPHFAGCTFEGNRAVTPNGNTPLGGGIASLSAASPLLDRCIVAYSSDGGGIYAEGPLALPALYCSDVNANDGGDYLGFPDNPTGTNGNISADPRFCSAIDFRLDPSSPCLPANNACGVLIGAFGQGCEETPVALASFAATPSTGAVDLVWEAEALADFRLTGARAAATWDVPWQAAGSGRFHARDESPQLAPGGEVSYRLEGRLPGEDWQLLRELAVTLPPAFATRLLAPHPNPFNPTVTLPFTLAAPGRVRLEVFDLAGRRIATLADGHFEAGEQSLAWDGRDAAGNPQASGVYFARLAAAGLTETKRLVLLR